MTDITAMTLRSETRILTVPVNTKMLWEHGVLNFCAAALNLIPNSNHTLIEKILDIVFKFTNFRLLSKQKLKRLSGNGVTETQEDNGREG
jgi:hypothetical protein